MVQTEIKNKEMGTYLDCREVSEDESKRSSKIGCTVHMQAEMPMMRKRVMSFAQKVIT